MAVSRQEKEAAKKKIDAELNAAGKKIQELLSRGLSTPENQLALESVKRLKEKKEQIIYEGNEIGAT